MVQNPGLTSFEIRDGTKRCTERFNECLAHPKLSKHQWLETGHAEFNLWSFGLNASHSGRSSLDYKVRQRADLREIITDLLNGLDESLEECLDPALLEEIDDSAGVPSPDENPESPLHFNVFNVKAILKQLTRLHTAIRKSGTQLRHHKADTSLKSMLENNVNGLEEFREDMIEAVLAGLESWKPEEGLPKPWANANRQLLERVVNANVRRRNRIFFATEKKRKGRARQLVAVDLEQGVTKAAIVSASHAGEETAKPERKREGMSKIGDPARESPVDPLPQRGSLIEESQAPTAATTIPLDAIIEQAPSKVAGTTITKATGTAQGETYPLPPKWPKDSRVPHIDCPYCSEPLTEKHIKRAAWNGHVSGDILPYICFIEDCNTPDDLYRTSEELTKHVISEHGVPCWVCDVCTPDSEQEQFEIFETAQLWREHLRYAHLQTMLDAEFSRLAELSMHKMVPPIKCPLCDYATLEIKPNVDPEITRHIHQFSIRCLPWEAQSEGNLSKERLKGKSSSASTSNSSNDRRHNAGSFEDAPNPNHAEMQPASHEQIRSIALAMLQRIFTSRGKHTDFDVLRQIDFSFYKERIRRFDRTSCELLLPTLVQLHCSMEEVLAFERYGDQWDEDQKDGPSLRLELSKNFRDIFYRAQGALGLANGGVNNNERVALVKANCGTDAYIHQWCRLLDQDFIPGDPDYVPRDEDEQKTLQLSTSQRLWNSAFDRLGADKDTVELVRCYIKTLSIVLGAERASDMNSAEYDASVDPTDPTKRQEDLKKLIDQGRKKILNTPFTANLAQVIHSAEGMIDAAIQDISQASLPWVGVCAGLLIILNPSTTTEINLAGITYITSRMDWYCALTEHLLKKENIAIGNESYEAVVKVLEKEIAALYKSLILYQMNSICSYHRKQGLVFLLRRLGHLDDWEGSFEDVKSAEAAVEDLSVRYLREYEKSPLRQLVSSGGVIGEVITGQLIHEDYTIGWVCALPKEQMAALYMLDSVHADLLSPPNDPNAYILGSIGNHNVVVAGMPVGSIDNNSSAIVASRMITAFPNIRVCLMVGIGGGVPPNVRLGDIVVSCPKNGDPGVIQWDMGKTEKGGEFKRTGHLNDPPTALLTALSKFEANPAGSRAKIVDYLEDLKHKKGVPAGYIKSDKIIDVLYKSKYTHVGKGHNTHDDYDADAWEEDIEEDGVDDCRLCDPRMVLTRPPREDLMIHYGLIASGNQVIKDGTIRDKLNKYLDGNVLCMEMEAAGLMNDFPCIVIRGICDYADSHKNEVWQEYAAATAAAYAKALLSVLSVGDIDRMQTIADSLPSDFIQNANRFLWPPWSDKGKEASSVPDLDGNAENTSGGNLHIVSEKNRAKLELPVLTPNDIVIAVMGTVGVGKSTFISYFAPDAKVGHDLQPCTTDVGIHAATIGGRKCYLIDTPGFDDTFKSDADILREVANWLNRLYQAQIRLAGIVYLHSIIGNYMGRSSIRNLRIFKMLCGDEGLSCVVLATTMWDMVSPADGEKREHDLLTKPDFWASMVRKGSKIFRQDNGAKSALAIMEYILAQRLSITLDIQKEMANGMRLDETGAGQEVQADMAALRKRYEDELVSLREEMEEALRVNDRRAQQEIAQIRAELNEKIWQQAEDRERMRVGLEELRAQRNDEL